MSDGRIKIELITDSTLKKLVLVYQVDDLNPIILKLTEEGILMQLINIYGKHDSLLLLSPDGQEFLILQIF